MDPVMIATISIAITQKLAKAFQEHQAAALALAKSQAEARDPTAEEWEALRAALADADATLDELLR